MSDEFIGSLWWDEFRDEFIILVERSLGGDERYGRYWEWQVLVFDVQKGIDASQIKVGSRLFMNEGAFLSPYSVFKMRRIA